VAKLLVEPNVEIKGHDKLAVLVSSEKDLDQFTEKVRALLVSLVLVRGLSRLRVQMNARICHRAKWRHQRARGFWITAWMWRSWQALAMAVVWPKVMC
jgi:hypothetical protein